ncbi:MAG: hypothetical protein ABFR33_05005, partial [Verrucomicrobiota bacterium]
TGATCKTPYWCGACFPSAGARFPRNVFCLNEAYSIGMEARATPSRVWPRFCKRLQWMLDNNGVCQDFLELEN